MPYFTSFYNSLIAAGTFLQPFFLLAVRLFWGWLFLKAGFAKFGRIEAVADGFGQLGIPLPLISAYLVAITEFVGGLFLMLGFASRLIALPLIFTMIVALMTAHYDVTSKVFAEPNSFIKESAFIFLLASLIIFLFGPGIFSVDAAIKRARS